MYSAKTLAAELPKWRDSSYGLNHRLIVFVVGFTSNVGEPQLLEALANHPGCKKLYFIPLDGPAGNLNRSAIQHDRELLVGGLGADPDQAQQEFFKRCDQKAAPEELLAYDVTDLLKRGNSRPETAKAIQATLAAHFNNHEVVPVTTDQANIYMGLHGAHLYDMYFERRSKIGLMVNDPLTSDQADYKSTLPYFSKEILKHSGMQVTPPCAAAYDLDDIRAFMDANGYEQIVLKESDNACGNGIFRVFRETPDGPLMGEKPRKAN